VVFEIKDAEIWTDMSLLLDTECKEYIMTY